MPPPQPKRSETSSLVVTIKYGGLKATQYFSKYTADSYQQLLNDLTELGFPHPKKTNIVFKSYGTLEFFWPIQRNENTFFVKNLVKRVNLPQEGVLKDEQQAHRKRLSIASMNIREDADYDPDFAQYVSAPVPKHPSKAGKKIAAFNKPLHQPSPPGKSSTKLPAERFHPYPRPTETQVQNHQSNSVAEQSSRSRLDRYRFAHQRAAEMFLDEIQTSLTVPIQPKAEPIEPSIPPPPPLEPPMAPLPQKHPSLTQRRGSRSEVAIKRERISPSISFSIPQETSVQAQSYIDLTHEAIELSSSCNSSLPLTFRPPPAITYQAVTSDMPRMAYPKLNNSNAALPAVQEPPLPQTRGLVSVSPKLPHNPVKTLKNTQSSLSIATPKAGDRPLIQSLTKELFDLRSNVQSALDRQNVIVEELRRLNATYVPSKLSLTPSSEAQANTAANARIDELEKEIDSFKAKEAELTQTLQAERNKRLEMESIVQDIEREQKSPFVVPALLEAFIKISQASTAAMQYQSSFGSSQ
ncbi:hypothetical protein NP233_g8594 [Leucocoprinus birnbaumii]|uniref:Uncharacterized protein n=1 Tax=Leucocoprinus birnbaumii TaxID=56174 RepID=A0AAD5YMZ9_9AGAR|nr:hypothetical protein NP233_g8594 [Leucocoprinus birnbaumii]